MVSLGRHSNVVYSRRLVTIMVTKIVLIALTHMMRNDLARDLSLYFGSIDQNMIVLGRCWWNFALKDKKQ